jgi:hypothetical protein
MFLGEPKLPQRYGATAVIVFVIGYCYFRFICILALGIWDFIFLKNLPTQLVYNIIWLGREKCVV